MRRSAIAVMAMLGTAVLGSCAAGDDADSDTSTGALPATIECSLYWRESDTASQMQESTLELALGTDDSIDIGPVRFGGSYVGDAPEGHALNVWVRDPDETPVASALYQFAEDGEQLRTDFSGGHGFTGLNYVRVGAGTLQYLCTAVG